MHNMVLNHLDRIWGTLSDIVEIKKKLKQMNWQILDFFWSPTALNLTHFYQCQLMVALHSSLNSILKVRY